MARRPTMRLLTQAARTALVGGLLGGSFLALPARAENPYSTTSKQEQQIFDPGSGGSKSNSIFDAKNPIDLMNTLRRNSAMDDATPPGDAIDRALKNLEVQSAPAGSGGLKGP